MWLTFHVLTGLLRWQVAALFSLKARGMYMFPEKLSRSWSNDIFASVFLIWPCQLFFQAWPAVWNHQQANLDHPNRDLNPKPSVCRQNNNGFTVPHLPLWLYQKKNPLIGDGAACECDSTPRFLYFWFWHQAAVHGPRYQMQVSLMDTCVTGRGVQHVHVILAHNKSIRSRGWFSKRSVFA